MMFWLFNDDKAWFRPKSFGYGSGLLIAWQGWVLLGFHITLIIGLTASVFVFAAVLAVFYSQSARETEAAKEAANQEKVEVAKITKTLMNSRTRTKTQQEEDIEEMLVAKRACEKELAACSDAGSH